jgi:hypothetical protein
MCAVVSLRALMARQAARLITNPQMTDYCLICGPFYKQDRQLQGVYKSYNTYKTARISAILGPILL